jgi:uncharacterized protein (TIGR02147 family)
MSDIFQYSDYRRFLNDWFEERKKKNPLVSYRMIARQVGYKSPGYLQMIISGKIGMSIAMGLKFALCMKLKKRETEYFQCMILFGEARSYEEKQVHFQKMLSFKEASVHTMDPNQLQYFEKWYHSAIRALLEFFPFKDEFAELAQLLVPPVSAAEVESSIKLLKDLNMIKEDDDGYLHPSNALVSTGYEASGFFVNNFLVNSLRLSEKALERFPRRERNFSSLTLGISEPGFQRIQQELREFRRKVMQIAADDTSERIYQLGFQFFPLSHNIVKKKKK